MPAVIDLRSDTVTQPTPEMRRAMADAKVGDDVFGEDPTVTELEKLGADLMGKESCLFVPSGTMGNLISILVHCPRGSEIILGDESHVFNYEQGGASALGGLVYHTLPTERFGTLSFEEIKSAIRDPKNDHNAAPGVICLENTHNRCGGTVLTPDYCWKVSEIAAQAKVPLHLDGARLANAAVALNLPIKDLAAPFDSVQFDLSKALASPVGGLIAGTRDFIQKARRQRKQLGGGWRQAGILAAAGVLSITQMIDRLKDDHANAKRLATSLSKLPHLKIDLETVQSNLVLVTIQPPLIPADFVAKLKSHGILAGSPRGNKVRFVTHYHISTADIDRVIETAGRTIHS